MDSRLSGQNDFVFDDRFNIDKLLSETENMPSKGELEKDNIKMFERLSEVPNK